MTANNFKAPFLNLPLELVVEMGRTKLSMRHFLQLNSGDKITLDRFAESPLDVFVNGVFIARGKIIERNGKLGLCLLEIVSQKERIKCLSKSSFSL